MGYHWVEIGHSCAKKGLKCECSRVKAAFQCMRTMGVSVPFLHRESTDSLISYTPLDTNHMYDTSGFQGIAMARSSLHGNSGSRVHL